MDKLFAKKRDLTIALIGSADMPKEKAVWYTVPQNVQTYLANINPGDIIEIKYDEKDGKRYLTRVSKTESAQPSQSKSFTSTTKTYGKTPEEQETIKRQAVGHMTSRTIIGLQGFIDFNNVETMMEKLYAKYLSLVNGN